MPHLTPRAERAVLAFIEASLCRSHTLLEASLCHTQAHTTLATMLGRDAPYAPLDFNKPTTPDLPDWQEYYHDDIDSYV